MSPQIVRLLAIILKSATRSARLTRYIGSAQSTATSWIRRAIGLLIASAGVGEAYDLGKIFLDLVDDSVEKEELDEFDQRFIRRLAGARNASFSMFIFTMANHYGLKREHAHLAFIMAVGQAYTLAEKLGEKLEVASKSSEVSKAARGDEKLTDEA